MLQIRLNKILNILIEFFILAIVFCVPIYFAIFLKNNNIFELNKIVLFKILVLLILLFSLIKAVLQKSELRRIYAVLFNKYLIIPLLFILTLLIATIFSIDKEVSLYGLNFRQQGLVSYIFYYIFFVLLLINLRNYSQLKLIIITASISSFLVSLYGVLQASGYDFINWREPAILTGRVSSSLGQPNFLASYLLLVIPLSGYLVLNSKKFLLKFFWIIVLFFQLLCLFLTYSRGGWLGLVGGLAVAGIIYLGINNLFFNKNKNKNKKKERKKIFIYFAFILISLFLTTSLLYSKNDFFASRVTSMADFKTGSIAVRLNFWQAGWEAFKARPIFGYGPETQSEIFVTHYKKDWAIYGHVNGYPNRAHNLFLDILLTSGMAGLFFYIVFLLFFLKIIISNIKEKEISNLTLAIFIGIISYLISLMFSFSVVTTSIYFWLFFAIIVSLKNSFYKKDFFQKNIIFNKYKNFSKLMAIFLLIAISIAVFFQINKNIKYLIADHYFRAFLEARNTEKYLTALTIYHYIDNQRIGDDYYTKKIALIISDWLDGINIPSYNKIGKEVLKNILPKIKTDNYNDLLLRAKIYSALAEEKKEFYKHAENNFTKAINLSPEMPKTYRELAKLYNKMEEHKKAIENYNKAIQMLPDINNPKMNDTHRGIVKYEKYLIYKGLGAIYLKKELFDEAEKYFWSAYKNNLTNMTIYKNIADVYYQRALLDTTSYPAGQGNLDKAIWYNKRGYRINPKDHNWPFAIALLYQEIRDDVQALEYAEKALELAPENEQIKGLMNDLQENL